MRKQNDTPPGNNDEADGLIRGWLRRADEFLRRPSSTGKTGGMRSDPDGDKDSKDQF